MISGVVEAPAWETTMAMMIEAKGSRRIETVAAPISAATAGSSENPGRWAQRSPATMPRNMAGKVGPPRALPSETLYARPLNIEEQRKGALREAGGLVDHRPHRVLA